MAEEKQEPEKKAPSAGGESRLRVHARKMERFRTAGLVAVQLIIVTIIFFQVNNLSCRRHTTWDLTQNRRFTLSETSASYLKSLGGEVRIVMAFLGTSDLYPEVRDFSPSMIASEAMPSFPSISTSVEAAPVSQS